MSSEARPAGPPAQGAGRGASPGSVPTASDWRVADALASLPGITAVALGGSRASQLADALSDTDLYAFHRGTTPDAAARAAALAPVADDGRVQASDAFGPEDHLTVAGCRVEVVHLDLDDLESQAEHAAGGGLGGTVCSTAFLHTVASCVPIIEDAALRDLRARLADFPEPTRSRILADSLPAMDEFLAQVRQAQTRGDLLLVTDRRAGFQAAWFNALFALNGVWHPGEKRLLRHAARLPLRPERMVARWADAVQLAPDDQRLPDQFASLLADLRRLADAPR